MPDIADIAPITQGIGAVAGLAQTLISNAKEKKENKKLNRFFSQRKAFKTPQEIFDNLYLQESNLQGYSDSTLGYLTGEAGAGLSSGLGAATRLGADPNQLSGLVDNYYKNIFSIGAGSELARMKQFDSVTNAMLLLAGNKEAEEVSKDNLIKDQMQAVSSRVRAAGVGVQSGANLLLNSVANLGATGLYGSTNTPNNVTIPGTNLSAGGSGAAAGTGGLTPSEIIALRNQIK